MKEFTDNSSSLVSIIMPTYNNANYIINSINFIIFQSYTNWELIITDDNSDDHTTEIVSCFIRLDNRIKLFKNEYNFGAAYSRNNSLKYARGRYIAFCDSDDYWRFDKLEKQVQFLNKNNLAFTFSSYNQLVNNNIIGCVTPPTILYYRDLLKFCPIGTSTVIYDTFFISKLEFPNFRCRQDYALWLIIFKNLGLAYSMKESFVDYNLRNDSLSANKFKAAINHFYVLRKVTNLNLLIVFYYFIFYLFRGIYIHYISRYLLSLFKS
ncbi:glycosyltransferase family 2 protein [Aquirufa sp. 2-AUSEE-184A6]|uniref:Glycosyltransferase family 2 protein n=1 Tax=Aquirufa novilacunae TaxID=3139305 RepID=A0ABW8SUX8_9BACT